MTKSAPISKKPRKQHSPAFRHEALKLAERIGVAAAARELSLYESQLYAWRSKQQQQITSSERESELAAENARLKRQRLENSDRWGDPRQKLLKGNEWQAQRVAICRALGHPTDGRKAVRQLATQLDEIWKTVSRRFDSNDAVSICNDGKYPSLTVSSFENSMSRQR